MDPIQLHNVSKNYDTTEALRNINISVREGELFGLIGPDGAGKTTLLRILTTLLKPSNGEASVLGLDVVKDLYQVRKRIGYMPGRFSLYSDLTVEENLKLFASLFQTSIEENYHLVKDIYIQLEPFKSRPAGKLSGGMKQKLALCCALIHKPEVLFLDEPSTGVDPVSRKELWDMLDNLIEIGITILVSTPYMDEAIRCHRVALMQTGEILSIEAPGKIIDQFPFDLYAVKTTDRYKVLRCLKQYQHTNSLYLFGDALHYTDLRSEFNPDEIIDYVMEETGARLQINRINPGIEDCFMELLATHTNDH